MSVRLLPLARSVAFKRPDVSVARSPKPPGALFVIGLVAVEGVWLAMLVLAFLALLR
jgi:hypothetical protein